MQSIRCGKPGRCSAVNPLSHDNGRLGKEHRKLGKPVVLQTAVRCQPLELSPLTAIGPLDGRYSNKVRRQKKMMQQDISPFSAVVPVVACCSRVLTCCLNLQVGAHLIKLECQGMYLQLYVLAFNCTLTLAPLLQVASLRGCFSEYALIKFRMLVECRWLQLLSSLPDLPEVPRFSPEAAAVLEELCEDFSLQTAQEVKDVERTTNHDVKAVEYVVKRHMSTNPELQKVLEFTHFACTSEDINNLAHGLMLKQARDQLLLPVMDSIVEALCHLAEEHAGVHAA
jgi:hypothetical protein